MNIFYNQMSVSYPEQNIRGMKPTPNLSRILHASRLHRPKQIIRCITCPHSRCYVMKQRNDFVEGEDEANIRNCVYNKFKNWVWFCEQCDNNRNIYSDRDDTNRHKRRYHTLKNLPKTQNANDDFYASETEFVHGTFFNHVPEEVRDLAFTDGLSKYDSSLREFISHFHEHAVGKFLVGRSQDKRH